MKLLAESTYALVLHGDGRWSHRLIEAMGSGAIPVIVADGLTLPYEQLIDWTDVVVRLPEKAVYACTDLSQFAMLLPRNPPSAPQGPDATIAPPW